jgi:hypothetical protein
VAVDLEVVELGLAVEIRGLARWMTWRGCGAAIHVGWWAIGSPSSAQIHGWGRGGARIHARRRWLESTMGQGRARWVVADAWDRRRAVARRWGVGRPAYRAARRWWGRWHWERGQARGGGGGAGRGDESRVGEGIRVWVRALIFRSVLGVISNFLEC